MLAIVALSIAIFFQLWAVYLSFRAIPYTKQRIIWISSIVVLSLMAVLRVDSLLYIINIDTINNSEKISAIVDLAISFSLVIVIKYSMPIFINTEQTEELLLQSLSALEKAEEIAHMGHWDWHILTNELFWSDEIYEIFGYSPEEFEDTFENFMMCVHPDDRENLQSVLDAALTQKTPYNIEHRIINQKTNQVRTVSEQGEVTLDSEGKPIRMFGIVQDITERVAAEDARFASEMRLITILNSSSDAIIMANQQGNIIHFNQGAEQIFGYSLQEVLGQSLNLLLPANVAGVHKRHIQEFAESEVESRSMAQRREVQGRRKDGSIFPAEVSISKLVEDDVMIYTAVLRDISDRKKAEIKIQQQLQNLTALREIDIAITGSTDIRLISNIILKNVLNRLAVDAAIIYQLNSDRGMLEHIAHQGFNQYTEEIKKISIPFGESHAGRVAWKKEMLRLEDIDEAELGTDFSRLLNSEPFKDYYCIPLIAKGQVKGALEIYNRSPINPSADWLSFFEGLGRQTAIALDNIELFNNWQNTNMELMMAYDTTLEGWSQALDLRDEETEGHSRRVTEMTLQLASHIGVSKDDLIHIRRGALLHDIGKMGVPDGILLKPGPLDEDEWKIMKQHPQFAYDMLSKIRYLKPALAIPYSHHEKWDGSGYPRGLKGGTIPLSARIFAVVDVWDALHSDRPYRKGWPTDKIVEHLKEQSGKHFDPHVIENFLQIIAVDKPGTPNS